MISILLSLFSTPLVSSIMEVVKGYQKKQLSEAELKAEVEKAILKTIGDIAEDKKDVIIAEVKSKDRVARIWRPIVGLSFAFILFFYAVLVPISVDWLGTPPLRVGDKLLEWIFTLLQIALGGYIAGNTLENITKTLVGRR